MIKPIESPDDQMAIVLGQRQLVAVCCMALVILGLVATLAYVCGRSITAAQMQAQQAATLPRGAIVVEAGKPQPSTTPSPLEARAEGMPLAGSPAAVPAAATGQSGFGIIGTAPMPEPSRGQTFWQVGVVDRGVATVFTEYLTRLGMRVRTAAGEAAGTYRVLVGPLTDVGETENTRRALQAAGFQYFLRRY